MIVVIIDDSDDDINVIVMIIVMMYVCVYVCMYSLSVSITILITAYNDLQLQQHYSLHIHNVDFYFSSHSSSSSYTLLLCMSLSTYHYFPPHLTITPSFLPSFSSITLCTISHSTVKRLSIQHVRRDMTVPYWYCYRMGRILTLRIR